MCKQVFLLFDSFLDHGNYLLLDSLNDRRNSVRTSAAILPRPLSVGGNQRTAWNRLVAHHCVHDPAGEVRLHVQTCGSFRILHWMFRRRSASPLVPFCSMNSGHLDQICAGVPFYPLAIYYTLIYSTINRILTNNLLLRIVTPQFPQMLHIHQYERAQFLKIWLLLFHSWLYVARPSDWRLVWYFFIS
jgi:hypothetical protein